MTGQIVSIECVAKFLLGSRVASLIQKPISGASCPEGALNLFSFGSCFYSLKAMRGLCGPAVVFNLLASNSVKFLLLTWFSTITAVVFVCLISFKGNCRV